LQPTKGLPLLIFALSGCGGAVHAPGQPAAEGGFPADSFGPTDHSSAVDGSYDSSGYTAYVAPAPEMSDSGDDVSSTDGGAGENGAPLGVECAVGVECAGSCVNTESDPRNCGDCGRACAPGGVCSQGICQGMCGVGLQACSGACVDWSVSDANCGQCGAACGPGFRCTGGRCTCKGTVCLGRCVDTVSDPDNCGLCGSGCAFAEVDSSTEISPLPQYCNDGLCQVYCSRGLTPCDRACVDTRTDDSNCAQCGVRCSNGSSCDNGACVCADGSKTYCGGICVDTQASAANCGACGAACPAGSPCIHGACAIACPSGAIACGNSCVDPLSTKEHCGLCDQVCLGNLVCSAGQCGCAAGFDECSGTCVDFGTDTRNCGACGVLCQGTEDCVNGVCQ
jgi:hypothetical protein